jgi:hypothetical protein
MENIEKCLHEIADDLMRNGNMPYFKGLYYGKLGIAIFLYNYYRYTGNSKYEDFASGLLDEVAPLLFDKTLPINYPYGLCGIGAGIEYLVQNGYIDSDTDEILEEFDSAVSGYLSYSLQLTSLNQIFGVGEYLYFRMVQSKKREMLGKLADIVMKLIELQFMREQERSAGAYLFLNRLKDHSENAGLLLDKYFSDYNQVGNCMLKSSRNFNIHDLMTDISTGYIQDKASKEDAISLLLKNLNTDSPGFFEGKAGIGMILLFLSGNTDSNWIRLYVPTEF